MKKFFNIVFIVRGLSGGHGDFEESFHCLRDAVSCFQTQGYANYPDAGSISIRIFDCIEFDLPWVPFKEEETSDDGQ